MIHSDVMLMDEQLSTTEMKGFGIMLYLIELKRESCSETKLITTGLTLRTRLMKVLTLV